MENENKIEEKTKKSKNKVWIVIVMIILTIGSFSSGVFFSDDIMSLIKDESTEEKQETEPKEETSVSESIKDKYTVDSKEVADLIDIYFPTTLIDNNGYINIDDANDIRKIVLEYANSNYLSTTVTKEQYDQAFKEIFSEEKYQEPASITYTYSYKTDELTGFQYEEVNVNEYEDNVFTPIAYKKGFQSTFEHVKKITNVTSTEDTLSVDVVVADAVVDNTELFGYDNQFISNKGGQTATELKKYDDFNMYTDYTLINQTETYNFTFNEETNTYVLNNIVVK